MPKNSVAFAHVEQVLNELDRLARIDSSPHTFYAELLAQLKLLLDAVDCVIVVPVHAGRWCVISTTNDSFADEAELQFASMISHQPAGQIGPWMESTDTLSGHEPISEKQKTVSASWLGRSLNGIRWSMGGILVKLPGPITSLSKELFSVIAETASSFFMRHELAQSESRSNEIRSIISTMISCKRKRQADRFLVDGVRCLVDADRVSLAQSSVAGAIPDILAISGQPQLDPKAAFHISLKKLLSSSHVPPSNQHLDLFAAENGSAVAVALPFGMRTSKSPDAMQFSHVLLLEWFDRNRYVRNASQLASTLSWVTNAWLALPRAKTADLRKSRLLRWSVAVASVTGIVLFFLSPTELTILSQGTLQPSEQRFVFAPSDGYVDTIQFADGQRVQAGEIIVSLASPQLQLQINQISSEIGIVDQKRDALNLAINQLKFAEDPSNLAGSRLVGEVRELETKRKTLIDQKALLDREHARLQLRSPIDGNVIAWEVEKYLENRPVRRGDTLLRIADLENNWRIEATVVDWEAGYLTDVYQKQTTLKSPVSVEFVVSSSAGEIHSGNVSHLSNTMRDVGGSQQLDFYVSPERPIQRPRLGTSATVSIPCGKSPRWFVWTRSILDAARRRFWF